MNQDLERIMLTEEQISARVKEVAAQLSFTDGHYFANSFKRQVGMPPGEFRKRFLSAKEKEK